MNVYISGKITGLSQEDAAMKFKEASEFIAKNGDTPINPVDLFPSRPDWAYTDYMREDIRKLLDCDAIYMLDNWSASNGAKIELMVAESIGLQVFYQKTNSNESTK